MENLKVSLITGKLDKTSSGGKKFLKADEHKVMALNCSVASAITSRYYKGLSAHDDNLVIVLEEYGNETDKDSGESEQ